MSAEFPFVNNAVEVESSLPLYRELAWDFENDCFVYDDRGNIKVVEKDDALKVWCYKNLRTVRFAYDAYSDRFGVEIYSLMGRVMTPGERQSELRRYIIDALMVNPYIRSVDSVDLNFDKLGRKLDITVKLSTIYGEITV